MRKIIMGVLLTTLCILLIIPVSAQTAQTIPETSDIQWDGQSRFTVLVTGLDRRPSEGRTLSVRTDVILVMSYDPANNSIGVMHIPRDLYFPLLDTGEQVKINTLYVRGNGIRANYGPQLLLETLQGNLGIYIDAYITFDFEGFIEFIDAIGGVTIDVPYGLSDPTFPDNNYLFDPFYISSGIHHMDGATALKYARTRHPDSDYRRGDRQLQVVKAVRDKLDDPIAIEQLLRRTPQMFLTFQNHVYSNLGLDQIVKLSLAVMQVPSDNVTTGALNERYTFNYGGLRVPDRNKLIDLMIDIFGENYLG